MNNISNGIMLLLFYAVSYNYIYDNLNYLRVVQLISVFIDRDALPIGGWMVQRNVKLCLSVISTTGDEEVQGNTQGKGL